MYASLGQLSALASLVGELQALRRFGLENFQGIHRDFTALRSSRCKGRFEMVCNGGIQLFMRGNEMMNWSSGMACLTALRGTTG